ncbi:MAG: transposase family protein, partial [Chthoniobacter sp.]
MTPNALFEAALQLGETGWGVSETKFQGEPKQLELVLEHNGDRRVVCPECQRRCTIYDRVEKRWRHLNFFQYRCELVAQVPR